ncbi:MAG TPA: response regulator [Pyrinomonadaceae bacterium]|nr:response regulator [Pyrinomonadaceae bacterium]
MNLQSQLATLQQQTRGLTLVERAQLCCGLAKQFEKAGEYEAASEALSEFWPQRHGSPIIDRLDATTGAGVLLRVGALAGWLGTTHQSESSQETAKNLITRSLEIFEELGQSEGVAEAHADLAICYWREGAFDEARINLASALSRLRSENIDLKACVLIRSGLVERTAGRLNAALRYYEQAAPLVEHSADLALKGTFHNGFAVLLRSLAVAENREDYLDRALIEFAAASYHFEEAGHERYCARVENNLGELFSTIGKFDAAHAHLNRARNLFLELHDGGSVAQVDETRARTFLAERRVQEAERSVRSAVRTLERGGEQALLAEALTTQGIVLARLGNYSRSKALLDRAVEVAETAGDLEGAGRANLSIIEELAEQTMAPELASIYQTAADLLQRSQDPSAGKRLIACARQVIEALGAAEQLEDSEGMEHSWEGFSFKREVLKSEKAIIERALKDAGGAVTKAARLLGFRHHQSLIALINSRHKDLLKTRSAVRPRRSHLFSQPRKIKKKVIKQSGERASSHISILHVADDQQIAKMVDEMFAAKEWHVELCSDGYGALEKLTGNAQYDVLVVDNDLPGLSGLELAQRAGKITHRRRTPIVLLSGSDCEAEAWGAGVDAFLRKPEQISKLPATINRVLKAERKKD